MEGSEKRDGVFGVRFFWGGGFFFCAVVFYFAFRALMFRNGKVLTTFFHVSLLLLSFLSLDLPL